MPISNQISNTGSYKYVVTGSEPGAFHTIQSALDYVLSQSESTTVLVRPGTYTENLTLYSGINIQGAEDGQVIIVGKHTPPASGTFTISNCTLQSATDIFNSAVAGTCIITVTGCTFKITTGYVYNLLNWTADLSIFNCLDISTTNNIANNTGGSALNIENSTVGTGGGAGMISSGVIRMSNDLVFCPLTIANASYIDTCTIGGTITLSGASDSTITSTLIESGSAVAINALATGVVYLTDVTIDTVAANAITGTSTVDMASVTFVHASSTTGITPAVTSTLRCNDMIATSNATILNGDLNLSNGRMYINGDYGTDGQVIIAKTGGEPEWASLTAGANITLTPGANSLTIAASGGGGMTWTGVTGDTAVVANHGYVNNQNGTRTVFTVPALATLGDTFSVINSQSYGTTSFKITGSATQNFLVGSTGGSYIDSTTSTDSITLTCIYASGATSTFAATSALGNFTLV